MSRLLILGVSPLPFESTIRSFGPGTRTWQIVEPLVDAGHLVTLVALRIPGTYPEDAPEEIVYQKGMFNYASILHQAYRETDYIRNIYREMQPDAVIFAHGSASYFEHVLEPEVPVWIDLCGHVMAEAQAKAAVDRDDNVVNYFFERSVGSLFHGDHYSTVSEAQKYALIGELGLAGRLNAANNGHDLVSVIPCGVEEEDYHLEHPLIRGIDVPEDAFIVLWSGGFNTWTDIDTMFGGLTFAMERDPSVYFVATGGRIDGHDEITYPRFVEMVDRSPLRDRFVLKGWIQRSEVPNTYCEADIGINCEKDIYEVRLGSKHRILDWSRASLPVVSTRVTELSRAIEAAGAGFVCDPEDSEALGRSILEAAGKKSELPEIGRQCRDTLRRLYGFGPSTRALQRWADDPTFAPDRGRAPMALQRVTDVLKSESRVEWLIRVVRKSYRDGGLPMVWRRMTGRM